MRTDKHAEGAEEAGEATPGVQVFAPGEAIPSPHVPAAAPRKFERGNGPLDTPKPLRRQVGRRIFEYGK